MHALFQTYRTRTDALLSNTEECVCFCGNENYKEKDRQPQHSSPLMYLPTRAHSAHHCSRRVKPRKEKISWFRWRRWWCQLKSIFPWPCNAKNFVSKGKKHPSCESRLTILLIKLLNFLAHLEKIYFRLLCFVPTKTWKLPKISISAFPLSSHMKEPISSWLRSLRIRSFGTDKERGTENVGKKYKWDEKHEFYSRDKEELQKKKKKKKKPLKIFSHLRQAKYIFCVQEIEKCLTEGEITKRHLIHIDTDTALD